MESLTLRSGRSTMRIQNQNFGETCSVRAGSAGSHYTETGSSEYAAGLIEIRTVEAVETVAPDIEPRALVQRYSHRPGKRKVEIRQTRSLNIRESRAIPQGKW